MALLESLSIRDEQTSSPHGRVARAKIMESNSKACEKSAFYLRRDKSGPQPAGVPDGKDGEKKTQLRAAGVAAAAKSNCRRVVRSFSWRLCCRPKVCPRVVGCHVGRATSAVDVRRLPAFAATFGTWMCRCQTDGRRAPRLRRVHREASESVFVMNALRGYSDQSKWSKDAMMQPNSEQRRKFRQCTLRGTCQSPGHHNRRRRSGSCCGPLWRAPQRDQPSCCAPAKEVRRPGLASSTKQ